MRSHVALAALALAACRHGQSEPPGDVPAPEDAGVADAGSTPAGFWRDDVFYEIFVRSFQDSDGDGVGDLAGLTSRLDHLNDGDDATSEDLGVTGLWLMPIHPSPSYHGYDVVDYTAVNPAYGTLADFDRFLAEAHRRGMSVILDFVLNHSSIEHPWFRAARAGEAAPERAFYRFRADDPGWRQPWGPGRVWHPLGDEFYYAIFWSGMPDLDLGNPEVERRMLEAMRFWLDRGVDGFRVDAARHLFEGPGGELSDRPETHAFVRRMRAALERTHPDVLLVAEAWTSLSTVASYYGQGDEFHLAFGFDTAAAIKTAAKDGLRASLNQHLRAMRGAYADPGFEAPFLANHDMDRVLRQLAGDRGAMRIAAATLLAMPGTPFLYYGEEIGMVGGPTPRDQDKRTPMRWSGAPGHGFTTGTPWHDAPEAAGVEVAAQRDDPGSLHQLYRALIRLRRSSRALSTGALTELELPGTARGVTGFLREGEGERVLFVANFHGEPSGRFELPLAGTPVVQLAEGSTVAKTATGLAVELGGRGFSFVELRR